MASQSQDDASSFNMAPEKIRSNSHPFPPNPGKSQSLPAANGAHYLPSRNRDKHISQNDDIVYGELKRKRSRKSDVQLNGLKQAEDLSYGYESYLAYDTYPPGFKGVKEDNSFSTSKPSQDFFNLSANSHEDPVWESDTKYRNLFSNQNKAGLGGSGGLDFTQTEFGWPNSEEFSQVPQHSTMPGATFLPFQFEKWDPKYPDLENGENFEFNQKEMIEEIEYMFAQNEWDLPNVKPATPDASTLGTSTGDQKDKDPAFMERSFFGDLWGKMGGQEKTHRFHDPLLVPPAEKDSSSEENLSQHQKVLHVEDLGDCSSLSSEEKLLLESLISKINSRKHENGVKGKSKGLQRGSETTEKDTDNSAIPKQSSIPLVHSTAEHDHSKKGQSRTSSKGSRWSQAAQNSNSSNLSKQDSPMLGDNTVDSARKRSKESDLEEKSQSVKESLSKRDHSGKSKEDSTFSPTPSKNAKMPEEKTLKKQKVLQAVPVMQNLVQKETIEPHKVHESDVEMENVDKVDVKGDESVSGFDEKRNVGTAAKRLHDETEKQKLDIDQGGTSPPQIKKKKKRKKKQGQSNKNNEAVEKSDPGPTPGPHTQSEPPVIPSVHQEKVAVKSMEKNKEEGSPVGDKSGEQMEDSKASKESKRHKPQQETNQHAKQRKSASAWTQVSRKKVDPIPLSKPKVGDGTDVVKDMSSKKEKGAFHSKESKENVKGGIEMDIDKTETITRNKVKSSGNEESPQSVHQSHIGDNGASFRRREEEYESHTTPRGLERNKDSADIHLQPSSSKSQDDPLSVPSERPSKGASSNSVPPSKVQGSQPVSGKTEAKERVVPNKAGQVLKDGMKSAKETSKSLPGASVSSSGDGKCHTEKESESSRSGVYVGKCGPEGDENVDRETNESKRDKERHRYETKSTSGVPHSTKGDTHHSTADEGLNKPSNQMKRDSERKDKSKEGKTFEESRDKGHDQNANDKQQRDRSNSGRKPGRDSTAKSKHSSTSRSEHIFMNNHHNFARWKKKMTLRNFNAAIFAIFVYLKCLAVDIWAELPQFGLLLLLCLLAQVISTFHYYKNIVVDAVLDIHNILAAILPVVLSKFSKVKFLWRYVLKPTIILAVFLVFLFIGITLRLVSLIMRLVRYLYQLRYPPEYPSTGKEEFTHHGASQNNDDTGRDKQESYGHNFSQDDFRQSQNHTRSGSWESSPGPRTNFSGYGEEFRGGAFGNSFNSQQRHETTSDTSGAKNFGSQSGATGGPSRNQTSQSSASRPVNNGAVTTIQRILNAEEEDPYDILGLGCDCSQEDIKKTYRRLAIIVHPDKCDHPDAQRAFQKLQVAHDKIGSEEGRTNFELEKRSSELRRTFMDEWQKQCDLINNSIRCECGNLHPKTATNKDPVFARYCWQHNTCHPAHQNDIWAETSCMGLKIHCFFCDGGVVYDITHWAQCQRILGSMEKNGCRVTVRMQSAAEQQNKPPPDFEDFFSQFGFGGSRGRGGSGSDRSRQKNSREKNNKKKKRNGRR